MTPSQPVIIFILKCEQPTAAYKMTMSGNTLQWKINGRKYLKNKYNNFSQHPFHTSVDFHGNFNLLKQGFVYLLLHKLGNIFCDLRN